MKESKPLSVRYRKGQPMTKKLKVVREHKDTVFRMLFQDKTELLKLYNALNDSSYDNPDELEVYTLENAIYMNVKNDVSFLLDSAINLYEHQASVNPNMPLRDLIYIARQYEKYIRGISVYSPKLVRIPVPKFVVFFNGEQKQPEKQILKLSDAFLKRAEEPDLELKVTMLNINQGYNRKLMEKCRTLKEYSIFMNRIRTHAVRMPVDEAVFLAVDECIAEGILGDFLMKQKSEVIAMSIFEYDEEVEMKQIRSDIYNMGLEDGIAEGEEKKLIRLICKKLQKGKTPEAIAEELEEELAVILPIVEKAREYAPEYDPELIYGALVVRPDECPDKETDFMLDKN